MAERDDEALRLVYSHLIEALDPDYGIARARAAARRALYDLGRVDAFDDGVVPDPSVWATGGTAADYAEALNIAGERLAADSRMVPAFTWRFIEPSPAPREDVARPRGRVERQKLPREERTEWARWLDWHWDCVACGMCGSTRTMGEAHGMIHTHLAADHAEPPC